MRRKIEIAAHAHTNLNIFAAIASILEGGTIYGSRTAQSTAQKIIRLCNEEGMRQLRTYDKTAAPPVDGRPKSE